MRKIKIAYIVNTLNFGGVEKYVIDIANNLNAQLFDPYIVSLNKRGPVLEFLKSSHIKTYEMHKKPGNDIRLPFQLAALFRTQKIDIIHSNNWGTFGESILARRLANIPSILHVQHGMELNDEEANSPIKRKIRNRMRFFYSNFVDELVTVSSAGIDFITKEWRVPRQKVKLIYNGVNLNGGFETLSYKNLKLEELGFSENDVVIGSVGRLSSVKNYQCLVKAFAHVYDRIKNTKLILIGDGDEKHSLSGLIRNLGLESNVRLLGQKSDIKSYLHIMDLFALSSQSEGISISILEAMSVELPVVVTNVGGNPEIVEHGKTGLLTESNNPQALAKSIIYLIENSEKRKEMGKEAQKRIEYKFSMKKMISSYEDLYISLLQSGKRKSKTL